MHSTLNVALHHVECTAPGLHDESFRHCAPDVRWSGFGQHGGLAEWRAAHMAFAAAFPDLTTRVLRTVVEGEWAVIWFSFAGTHTGPFMGLPPTDRAVHAEAVVFDRVVGGRCVEHHNLMDQMSLMRQLGQA